MEFKLIFKKKFRGLYYLLFNRTTTVIKKPSTLRGAKWLILKENDRAYFKGYYEPEITRFISENLKKESVFFDVGAHVGYFSLLASKICVEGKSCSFEPFPENIEFIKQIRKMNFNANWILVEKALSDSNGKVVFEKGDTSSTGRINHSTKYGIEIATTTLDKFIEKEGEPDLVKIDVEGHGANVLRGFTLLKNSKKKIKVLIEIHQNSEELEYIKKTYNVGFKVSDLHGASIDLSSDSIPHHIIIERE